MFRLRTLPVQSRIVASKRFFAAAANSSLQASDAELLPSKQSANGFTFEVTEAVNGLKVATVDTQGALSSIGVYVLTGSSHETHETNGCTHFLQHLSLQSAKYRTPVRLTYDMEKITPNFEASKGREVLAYTAQMLRSNVSEYVPLMAEILQPRIKHWEVNRKRPLVARESMEAEHNPSFAMSEMLHREAFRHVGLGRSTVCPYDRVHNLGADVIAEHVSTHFQPQNTLIVAAGVEKGAFLDLVNKEFADYQQTGAAQTPTEQTPYRGGVRLNPSWDDGLTTLGLAFHSNTGGKVKNDGAVFTVLSELLGREVPGDNHYTHGVRPGSGSRFAKHGLQADAFNHQYTSDSLFGITIAAGSNAEAQSAIDAVKAELDAIQKGNVTEEELLRAVQLARRDYFDSLSTIDQVRHHVAASFILDKNQSGTHDLLSFDQQLQAVTKDDLSKAAAYALSAPPTLVGFGDVGGLHF